MTQIIFKCIENFFMFFFSFTMINEKIRFFVYKLLEPIFSLPLTHRSQIKCNTLHIYRK